MNRVDFIIGNDRHHAAMVRPVLAELGGDIGRRVLSLCELRGLRTPADLGQGVRVETLSRRSRRRARRFLGTPSGGRRRLLRALAWRLVVSPRLGRLLAERPPDLAVLPNDAVYPYDRIVAVFRRRGVPFLLLQEGIRFELPGVDESAAYGRNGATAIAAWGPASRDYFIDRGVDAERIEITGSPRFDGLTEEALAPAAAELRQRLGGSRFLLLVTNPIDQQGFCSPEEKMELVERFLARAVESLPRGWRLAIRVHAGESRGAYDALVDKLADRRVQLLDDAPLHPLLAAAEAVIVMASTVGLEALLLGRPLAVLETPGHGFVHDYVARRAATGLPAQGDLEGDLRQLVDGRGASATMVRAYLDAHLVARGRASSRVAALIRSLLG